jgi:hypothetical protein
MDDDKDRALIYRNTAEEIRIKAESMKVLEARRMMFDMVSDYEAMADRLDRPPTPKKRR